MTIVSVNSHHRGGIEDAPLALQRHIGDHRLGAVKRSVEIHPQHPVKQLRGHFVQRRVPDDARVADEAVNPAEGGIHFGGHCLYSFKVRYVGGKSQQLAARGCARACKVFDGGIHLGLTQIHKGHPCTALGQHLAGLQPDAARAAGYDNYFSLESVHKKCLPILKYRCRPSAATV
ncbi:hypothetical protein SDC9_165945 [bioreactor metagenome]|uniref:Uncharacterized protein n=1 Tax=bioreactor metagenome TaxID=1076179 RepID=A0A645FVV6_9ZZZZ